MKPAMASATLADIKTHTRRIVKCPDGADMVRRNRNDTDCSRWVLGYPGYEVGTDITCPYGGVGDRLWVREEHYRFGHWEPVKGVKTKGGRQKWRFVADRADCIFAPPTAEYGEPTPYRVSRDVNDPAKPQWYKRLARFMPRALSRMTLEIVEVRIERLNHISHNDCLREGLPNGNHRQTAFRELWESINGAGSWAKNPLVWVIVFRRIKN